MPRYVYHCTLCDKEFQVFHSMKEVWVKCDLCDARNTIRRIPQMAYSKKITKKEKPIGSLVKQYIEETKDFVKEKKEELKKEVEL